MIARSCTEGKLSFEIQTQVKFYQHGLASVSRRPWSYRPCSPFKLKSLPPLTLVQGKGECALDVKSGHTHTHTHTHTCSAESKFASQSDWSCQTMTQIFARKMFHLHPRMSGNPECSDKTNRAASHTVASCGSNRM